MAILMYTVISEVFGLKYYATLFNFGNLASPVGSYIRNVLVACRLYDKRVGDKWKLRVLAEK
ncbi:hypothetical protein PanWU01x14_232880 [Parasponia andersonii]|uniref:Uncharacterized protein n=1 Tax=Parasponia andersonii TaxID=3476 RepID=A0A2P5BJQ5_PARAD|nr:hypothetical protein PanWU01x14_232880 [Parasponia andersonii]